jgi:hypothetical protein
MSEDSQELLDTLRELACRGPCEAPAHVEELLTAEFRRRNRRRRNLATWIPALGVAVAAGIALLLWIRSEEPRVVTAPAVISAHLAGPSEEEDADRSFYPLPEAEALPPVETAMVVRVQLPVSSLQLMGVPIGEEGSDSSVQADLLLGQDGLARGVRLAQ